MATTTPPAPRTPWRQSAPLRWALGTGLVFVAGVVMVLLFLLTVATNNRVLYETYFGWLVGINIAVAGVLLAVIGWVVVRLTLRMRRKKFGSQLLVKLALIFGLVGFLPGLLIYTVSYQFVSRSIESWFDVRVESALTAGLNLGRNTLDVLSDDLATKTRVAANALSDVSNAGAGLALERIREQLGVKDVILWSAGGQAIAAAGDSRFALKPERPPAALLRNVRAQRALASVEGLEEGGNGVVAGDIPSTPAPPSEVARIRALAVVNVSSLGLSSELRYLEVVVPLSPLLVADALAVQAAHREYQERALARQGLRRMYIGTLTLALFLAVFGAVLLAVLLGNQLVRPLLVLAEGMREVAKGDLRPKAALTARDELAGLTRTFAHMTQDLADARAEVQRGLEQVDAARANLQTILDNLTAGVVVLDEQGAILSVNPGAARILHRSLSLHLGQVLATVPGLEVFGQGVMAQFDRFLSEQTAHEGGHWQQSFELSVDGAQASMTEDLRSHLTLIARGAILPHNERLLVFDDVSDMISAQRSKAWGEVARRLAHEIKNPLTPIQLSAERLAMKLEHKVSGPELALLNKSVKTIVDQVDAMKRLVNEFRDYARLPAAQLTPLDLNALVLDVLSLYDQAEVPVRHELDPLCPPVMADPQQVRQVVHNLVQNAQDATAPGSAGVVCLRTRRSESGRWVRLIVTDEGSGFAEHILQRAFEPYVTTKTKGTGLGLAVVKKIMDEHGGRIDLSNRMSEGRLVGAQVSLSFAVAN
ncbi:sensor histidine kinase [Hydrogenophaga atypica]|uniref:histidine kinase n=1 Tax=Hydrogenophaga atypica TaxID=249409 RepID=A0ABW2QN83_9BURK